MSTTTWLPPHTKRQVLKLRLGTYVPTPPPQPGPQTQYIAALLNIPKLFISEVNSFVYYGKLIFNLTEESEFEFESDLWHLASLITLACSALS